MPQGPKTIEERITDVTSAWANLAADKSFGGMTLAEFKAKVKPSDDARKAIKDLDSKYTAALNARDDADAESSSTVALVVNGVKGDVAFGENSAVYEAMGCVRKSGLKRGKNHTPAPTPA